MSVERGTRELLLSAGVPSYQQRSTFKQDYAETLRGWVTNKLPVDRLNTRQAPKYHKYAAEEQRRSQNTCRTRLR